MRGTAIAVSDKSPLRQNEVDGVSDGENDHYLSLEPDYIKLRMVTFILLCTGRRSINLVLLISLIVLKLFFDKVR